MKTRYTRNIGVLSEAENNRLADFRVCVAGCGGLGGHVLEHLGRLGVGQITAIDGDVFEASNLNRQILSEEPLIGTSKVAAAAARMLRINSNVVLTPIHAFLTEENAGDILPGHDLIVDALDTIPARLMLEKKCEMYQIPLIHGAIGGWYGQVAVVFPGERILEKLYPPDAEKGIEVQTGNPSFAPALVASIQVCEAVKLLLKKEGLLRGNLLSIDMLYHEYELVKLHTGKA